MSLSASTAPQRLPSGRHRIPDQDVRENQSSRLIDAISHLSLERGYPNIVISDIVARAGVSKSTFYRFYRTKEECLFDAHKRHCASLIAAVDRTCGEGRPGREQLRVGIRSALTYLSANPQAAHLLTIGILSCGPRGERRYAVMIDALRVRLQAAGVLSAADSELAAVLFAASTIAHALILREEIKLLELESELIEILLAIADRSEGSRANRINVGSKGTKFPLCETQTVNEGQSENRSRLPSPGDG